MSGRKRIIVAGITEKKLKGKELAEALDRELNADEKGSTYQHKNVSDGKNYK